MASGKKTKKKDSITNLFIAKGSIDIPFFLLLMTIVTIGLVMVFSASYTYSYYHRGGSTVIFVKQLIFTCVGLGWFQEYGMSISAILRNWRL